VANTSPWAQVQQQAQPLAPPDMAMPDAQPNTQVFAPTPPAVTRAPSPQEQMIGEDQKRLEKVRWQQENPWGTPENHPGKLGKVAHVFSTLGNIAGDIFAPATMSLIPGTQLNRQAQETGLTHRLNTEIGDESQNENREAEREHTMQETQEMPAEAASKETLEGEQGKNIESEIGARDIANQGENPDIATFRSLRQLGMSASDALKEIERDKAMGLKPPSMESKPGVFRGKPAFGNFHPDTGQYTDEQGRPMEGFQPQPQAAQLAPWMINPQDNSIFRPRPGQSLPAGSMSPTQLGQGAAADVKEQKAEQKNETNMDSELSLMKQFAASPSPTNDAAMLMHYIGATKPESMGKIRLNDRELKLFGGTRSSLGDAEALLTKVANGQPLTPQQRNDMVNTMTMIDSAAKRPAAGAGQAAAGGANEPKVLKFNQQTGRLE
jgi:hypothetical protein